MAYIHKNVLQLLYIIAHEIIVSNSVSEYTHGPWKVSDACTLRRDSSIHRLSSSQTDLCISSFYYSAQSH